MKCAVYHCHHEARRASWVDTIQIDGDLAAAQAKVNQAIDMRGYEYVARISVWPEIGSDDKTNMRRAEELYRLTSHDCAETEAGWGGGEHVVFCKDHRTVCSSSCGDLFVIDAEVYVVARPFGYVKVGGKEMAKRLAGE